MLPTSMISKSSSAGSSPVAGEVISKIRKTFEAGEKDV